MKKLIIILFILFSVVSCNRIEKTDTNINTKKESIEKKEIDSDGNYIGKMSEDSFDNTEKTMEEKLDSIKLSGEEYGDLRDFIKSDLDEDNKQAILKILEQRKERQKEISKILNDAIKDNNFEEKFKEVKEMRSICQSRILPYVSENKKEEFVKMCNSGNIRLKALYISKINNIKIKNNSNKITKKIKEINENQKNEK